MSNPSRILPVVLAAALGLPVLGMAGHARAQQAPLPPVAPPVTTAPDAAPAPLVPPPPFVEPSPAAVDFGQILDGEKPRSTVTFTNTSDADRALAQVRTSCGCTVATVHGPDGAVIAARSTDPTQPIVTLHPGQSISVDVELNTANAHGVVEKQLQVDARDSAFPSVMVPVRARVTKAFSVTPESVNIGKVTKNGVIEQAIVIESQVEGDWTIDGFSSGIEGRPLPPDLQFNVLDTEGAARRVQLLSPGGRAVGPLTLKVHVEIGHERAKGTDFYVYGVVESDVKFDTGSPDMPDSINFGQMEAGSSATRTLKITNADAAVPYLLERVEVESSKPQFITTAIRTVEEGRSYEVDVAVDAAIDEPFFRGMLVLHAQHPEVPDKKLLFHGWVRKG